MSWAYRSDERALKKLRKLGKPTQREIIAYLDERTAGAGDPRRFGKGLKADLAGLWRYRVGDYRKHAHKECGHSCPHRPCTAKARRASQVARPRRERMPMDRQSPSSRTRSPTRHDSTNRDAPKHQGLGQK
jgi:mRNA interferase RelE/StbE